MLEQKRNGENHSKLKASTEDFIGPLLTELAKGPEDNDVLDEIKELVEKTKGHLESRENWDSELMCYFQEIERQIERSKENQGVIECSKENQGVLGECSSSKTKQSSKQTWHELKNKLKGHLDRAPTISHEEKPDFPDEINTTFEIGEPSDKDIPHQKNGGPITLTECMNELDLQQMVWLKSLGIFPEQAEIKRTLLMYFWIGLGIDPKKNHVEELAGSFFLDLVEKGILLPVYTRKHNQVIDRFMIHHIVHSQLISVCKTEKLLIDKNAEIEGTWHFYHNKMYNLRGLLNLDQKYLNSEDIITSKNDVLGNNKAIKFILIGRWRCTDLDIPKISRSEKSVSMKTKSEDHIEVDKTDFLKKIGKKVTFLSLQGISRIEKLPQSIGKIEDLTILNLRACHNLEELPHKPLSLTLMLKPDQVKWFNNLTHLDISECHLLYHMPKWICELSNLEVFKGFVATKRGKKIQFCRLRDLSKLKKLRKLSIRIAKHLDPLDASGLESLYCLSVLTIIWCINKQSDEANGKKQSRENDRDSVRSSGVEGEHGNENKSGDGPHIIFPKNLEKLDIRRYPKAEAHLLLNASCLPKLKRLYIRGGNLTRFPNDSSWQVLQILRLRHLKYFEIDWSELSDQFTKLEYVEFEDCHSIKNFPKNRSAWDTKIDGHLSDAEDEPLKEDNSRRSVKLKTINSLSAPLAKNEKKIMLELIASDIRNGPRLALVVILDVSGSMKADNKFKKMKTAILFMIKKLRPTDRLSIVIFSTKATVLWKLQRMTESSQKELESLVKNLKADDNRTDGTTNIIHGLQIGLDILREYNVNSQRTSGLILMSKGVQSDATNGIANIHFGNVPVHTFGIGEYHDPVVLNSIANNSMGGTFSDVGNVDNLIKALAMCLAGLLNVVAQDLTLTLTPTEEGSTVIKQVHAGAYQQSNAAHSVTVKFGDLYSGEDRKVFVDILLPADFVAGPQCTLDVSYSYKLYGMPFVSPHKRIVVSCAMLSPPKSQCQREISEGERVKMVEVVRKSIALADDNKLESAQKILKDVEIKENHAYCKWLRSELEELLEIMASHETYKLRRAFAYSLLTSHDRQRSAARGDDIKKSIRLFAPPFVQKFLKDAAKFDAYPKVPGPIRRCLSF